MIRSFYALVPGLGMVLMVFSLTMAVPLGFAWVQNDGAQDAHALAMAITALAGLLMLLLGKRSRRELQPRDGFLLVALVWMWMQILVGVLHPIIILIVHILQ